MSRGFAPLLIRILRKRREGIELSDYWTVLPRGCCAACMNLAGVATLTREVEPALLYWPRATSSSSSSDNEITWKLDSPIMFAKILLLTK